MRREEAAARARLLPSTEALICSAHDIKTLDGYFEEKSLFKAYILINCWALVAEREIRTLFKPLL